MKKLNKLLAVGIAATFALSVNASMVDILNGNLSDAWNQVETLEQSDNGSVAKNYEIHYVKQKMMSLKKHSKEWNVYNNKLNELKSELSVISVETNKLLVSVKKAQQAKVNFYFEEDKEMEAFGLSSNVVKNALAKFDVDNISDLNKIDEYVDMQRFNEKGMKKAQDTVNKDLGVESLADRLAHEAAIAEAEEAARLETARLADIHEAEQTALREAYEEEQRLYDLQVAADAEDARIEAERVAAEEAARLAQEAQDAIDAQAALDAAIASTDPVSLVDALLDATNQGITGAGITVRIFDDADGSKAALIKEVASGAWTRSVTQSQFIGNAGVDVKVIMNDGLIGLPTNTGTTYDTALFVIQSDFTDNITYFEGRSEDVLSAADIGTTGADLVTEATDNAAATAKIAGAAALVADMLGSTSSSSLIKSTLIDSATDGVLDIYEALR